MSSQEATLASSNRFQVLRDGFHDSAKRARAPGGRGGGHCGSQPHAVSTQHVLEEVNSVSQLQLVKQASWTPDGLQWYNI